MTEASCGVCRYFGGGLCRRRSPSVQMVPALPHYVAGNHQVGMLAHAAQYAAYPAAFFPNVQVTDWCGEFRPRGYVEDCEFSLPGDKTAEV